MHLFVLICILAYRFWFYDDFSFVKTMAYTSIKITKNSDNHVSEMIWEYLQRHFSLAIVVILQLWQI